MSLTNKEKAKIQATNKALLDEYKKEVVEAIDEYLRDYIDTRNEHLPYKARCLILHRRLLNGCECNKATLDFIKQQIG